MDYTCLAILAGVAVAIFMIVIIRNWRNRPSEPKEKLKDRLKNKPPKGNSDEHK